MAITARKLFEKAYSSTSTSLHYTREFVRLVRRIQTHLGIPLKYTLFVFPKERWHKFVVNHPLIQWMRELEYREDTKNNPRVNALLETIEHHYT